ncbi:MAG: hypothetical protein Q8O83_02475 [bacterium]|nr:hypothetical protein [bacterium]
MTELNKDESLYDVDVAGRKISGGTHNGPHGEEIYCLILLYLAGRLFKGIGAFLDVYAPDNTIYFGVRNGPFDEHPPYANEEERKKKENACALTLFADALKEFGFDVMSLPAVKATVEHLLEMDSRAKAHALDITNIIKEMHRYYRDHAMEPKTIAWAFKGFLAKLHEDPDSSEITNFNIDYIGLGLMKGLPEVFPEPDAGQQWYAQGLEAHTYSHETLYQEARCEYKQKVTVTMKGWVDIEAYFEKHAPVEGFRMMRKVKRQHMGDLFVPIVFIQSNNVLVGRYARSKEARKLGIHAGILIQRNSRDQYFINFDNKIEENGFQRFPIEGSLVVALLRNEYRKKDGLKQLQMGNKRLYVVGESADAPDMFYSKKDTESILNGSETRPHAKPLPFMPPKVLLCVIRGVREQRR